MILLEVDLAEDGHFPKTVFTDLFALIPNIKAVRIKGVRIASFYEEACRVFQGQYLQIEEKNTLNYILYNRRHNQIVNANYYGKFRKLVILPTTTKVTVKISSSSNTENIVDEMINFKWPDHIAQLTFAITNGLFIDDMFEALITQAKTLLNEGKLNEIQLISKKTSFILRKLANSIEAEVKLSFKMDTWTAFKDEYYYEKLNSVGVVFKTFELEISASSNKRANRLLEENAWPGFCTHLSFVAIDKEFDTIKYEMFIQRATKLLMGIGKFVQVGLSMHVGSVFVRKLFDKSIEIDVKLSSDQILLPYRNNYCEHLLGSSVVIGAFKVEVIVPANKVTARVAKEYACPSYVTHLAFKSPAESFDAITVMWIYSVAVDRFNCGELRNIEAISPGASINIPKLTDEMLWVEVTFLTEFFELPDLDGYYYYYRIILSEKFNKEIEACDKLKNVRGVYLIEFRGAGKQFQRFLNHLYLLPIPEKVVDPLIEATKKPYNALEMMVGPACAPSIEAMEFIANNFENFRRLYIQTTETIYQEGQKTFYHLESVKLVDEIVCNARANFNYRTGYCFYFEEEGSQQS